MSPESSEDLVEALELDHLGFQLDLLAVSSNTDFWDQARANLVEDGYQIMDHRLIRDGARALACTAVAEWAVAVEAAETQG